LPAFRGRLIAAMSACRLVGLSACRQCDQPPHRGERCTLWVARLSMDCSAGLLPDVIGSKGFPRRVAWRADHDWWGEAGPMRPSPRDTYLTAESRSWT
jgi:hypothetical protein